MFLFGVLLKQLTVADALYSGFARLLRYIDSSQSLAALGVGTLIAPMNGSVASSAFLMSRLVTPRLTRIEIGRSTALVSAAATIGVIVPPSLVLILLGDAMMRAHTEASNIPGFNLGQQRIINTQDVFNAALLPGIAILALWAVVVIWQNRKVKTVLEPMTPINYLVALLSGSATVVLLGGVFTGKLLAVEAAATACVLLVVVAVGGRSLTLDRWIEVLEQSLALTGALIAMLIGATVFSFVFRLWGTDHWLTDLLLNSSVTGMQRAFVVLAIVAACAWVLDAFEMIFVIIPILAPALIVTLHDAQQAAVLLLLVLQVSFLIPPMGYAVMMARIKAGEKVPLNRLLLALAPFVLVQLFVILVVFFSPQLIHMLDAPVVVVNQESDDDLAERIRAMSVQPMSDADTGPNRPQ